VRAKAGRGPRPAAHGRHTLRVAHGLRSVRRRRGGRAQLQAELADVVALLGAALRAGAAPALALLTVAGSTSLRTPLGAAIDDLAEAAALGLPLSRRWREHAERLGSPDLRFVARAWALTERTGAPLAEGLAAAEAVLRARDRARERVATATAGPRASMAVLAALPCTGPLVGLAFGLGPGDLYLSSPAAMGASLLGLALGLVGWVWGRRIVGRAQQC
jgi:tight adherence protein B